jgi:hypothetical protein
MILEKYQNLLLLHTTTPTKQSWMTIKKRQH